MKYFIINSPVAAVHNKPKFQSEMVTQALLGETCTLLKNHENWRYVRQWDGYEGWIHSFYGIESEDYYEPTHSFFELTGFSEHIKESRKIVYGTKLKLTNTEELLFPDGWEGSAPKGFRSISFKASRDNLLKEGRRFLGVPYLWGGKSSLGIDCSGLIQTIFKSVGIKLPRDVWQQVDYFKDHIIPLDSIKCGDILFFGKNEKIIHTALSSGGPNFLHSQGWVKEESLDKFRDNFNEECFQIFKFSVSVEHLVIT
jgi:cell wall-associated NlpC family hydrolase